MNTKAILAGLAGGVFAFFGGWLVFGILLMDFYMSNSTSYDGLMKEMPDMVWLVISNLAWGFLYAYIFSRWTDVKTFGAGLMAGLPISFIIVLSYDTGMYSFYNLQTLTLMLVDIAVGTLFGGLVGGVVGLVLGTGKQ
jgi:hypothetical protein